MPAASNKNLVLAAMVFAVAMTFIDQTIVAIAVPDLETTCRSRRPARNGSSTATCSSLAALFAFGGRLGDVLGRRRMVTIGVIGFAAASAFCGLTPTSGIAEAWIVFFRVVQGAFAALLFPAAVGIVVGAFPVRERGKAMAIFFGDHRRPDRARAARGRVPDPVDLALDLLDQHPGRDRRAVPDLALEARRHAAPVDARLPRHDPDLRRHGPARARAPAVEHLGLELDRDLGVHRRRPGAWA